MSYDLRSALGWITVVSLVVAVSSYLVSMAMGAALVAYGQFALQLRGAYSPLLLWAYALPVWDAPANSTLIVAGAVFIFAVCLLKAGISNGGFLRSLRELSTGGRPKTLPNWLTIMPLVGSGLLVIVVLLGLLQDLFGVGTGSLPTNNPIVLVPSLALAPIAEEVGFRMTILGLTTGILVAMKFGRDTARGVRSPSSVQIRTFFSAFLSPGRAKEHAGLLSIRTGGLKGIGLSEWILLFVSSFVFGVYHIIGASGWGPGKLLTAAISGFALGIVFLAYGAFANILLHWFFDFYFLNLPGLPLVYQISGDLFTLGAIALGIWAVILAIYWLSRWNPRPVAANPWQVPQIPRPC